MPGLTTHILDLTHGKPAEHVKVQLFKFNPATSRWRRLAETVTNKDGRTDAPLLSAEKIDSGLYQLVFSIGAYFRSQGANLPDPPFWGEVPVRFNISDPAAGYHIPLLISPWGYQTYRGS